MAVEDSPGAGRVLIALADGPLVAEPTWTRYDSGVTNLRCYGYNSYAGRQSELDTTDTGHATVYFHDLANVLDEGLVGKQIMLQLYNPEAAAWYIRWRGRISDVSADLVDVPGIPVATTAVECVGVFDYLGRCKMIPGTFGDVLPTGMTGVVFYEDGRVDVRVTALFDDAGLVASMYVVFTGNVDVNETLYDPDDVILQALRDAADAEFPGVANVYEDRVGRVAFHGRFARFDPETVAASASNWDFVRWDAATREDVTTGVAQIKDFAWNAPLERIINAYLAYPREDENGVPFDRADIPTLQQMDSGSISSFGYSGKDAPDLIIKENFNNSNTGAEECALFGEFYVTNYADPAKAVRNVVFKSVDTADARAAATWDLMCRADVADAIQLTIAEAELADVAFFIDGIAVECRMLNPSYDIVTVTPNLTPASYYGTDVFNP